MAFHQIPITEYIWFFQGEYLRKKENHGWNGSFPTLDFNAIKGNIPFFIAMKKTK